MKEVSLEAKKRTETGEQSVRKLRNRDIIPSILYGKGIQSVPLEINKKDIVKIINAGSWESVVIDLKLQDEDKVRSVIIKDIQIDSIKRTLLHVDLCEISLKDKIKVHVHIEVVGEAPGVKNNGGMLEHVTREIECLPNNIPGNIKVDVSNLEIGDSISVADLTLSEDIKIITDSERMLLKVIPPTVLEEKVAEETPLSGTAEPEVISKGKKEEKEEAEKE